MLVTRITGFGKRNTIPSEPNAPGTLQPRSTEKPRLWARLFVHQMTFDYIIGDRVITQLPRSASQTSSLIG